MPRSLAKITAWISNLGTNRKVWEEHLSHNYNAGEGLLGLLVCSCSYSFSSVAAAAHSIPVESLGTPWCDPLRHRAMTVVACQAAGIVLKKFFLPLCRSVFAGRAWWRKSGYERVSVNPSDASAPLLGSS